MATAILDPEDQSALPQALSLHRAGKIKQARDAYIQLSKQYPRNAEILYLLGTAECQCDNLEAGAAFLRASINISPNQANAYNNLGNALRALRREYEALICFERSLAIQPNDPEVHHNRGIALKQLHRWEEALASYDKALAIRSDYFAAHLNRAMALKALNRPEEALASYDEALIIAPDHAVTHASRAALLKQLHRLEEALASYDRALAIRPDYAEAHNNRGNVLRALNRLDEALGSYRAALSIRADYGEALNNLGNILRELNRPEEALACFDQLIAILPDNALAHSSRATALICLNRPQEALTSCDMALTIRPDYFEVHNNRGIALSELNLHAEALACFNVALAINPDKAEVHNNRGNALIELNRHEDALTSFDKAIAVAPDIEFSHGRALHTRMHLSDWTRLSERRGQLLQGISNNARVSEPFAILAYFDSPELHRRASELYASARHPPKDTLPQLGKHSKHEKVRIGYFSADFHDHATMHLMAEVFELHDRDRFEPIAFTFGPDTSDAWHKRATRAFDRLIDVRFSSDREVASLARQLEIDIAIDLKGYTKGGRPGIFANRAAPIQVNYLGYPGTMGAPYFDYLIADRTILPDGLQRHYSEKIIYLPNSYQANCRERKISGTKFTRSDLGLPDFGFVFCSHNNNYKITPEAFTSWARILSAVPDSVLWLLVSNPTARANLCNEAVRRGIDSNRLIFAAKVPVEVHLNRLRLADLFLDTFPYNAHTTASDALRVGLPIVTRIGESFASRVGASLLNAAGLPDLVSATPEEYEVLAIRLATEPDRLSSIKGRLLGNFDTCALFDTKRFTRDLESAYLAIYERCQRDLRPDHLVVV